MSVYRCNRCDNHFDGDFVGCEEDPNDKKELICPDCFDKISEQRARDALEGM